MNDNIKGLIASIVLLSVITGTVACTPSTISQDLPTDRSKKENDNTNSEHTIEKEGISSEDLFVIDTESTATLYAENAQRYYILRKTNIDVPTTDDDQSDALIYLDIFNKNADAYVGKDLSWYNYCDYSKSTTAFGVKTDIDPALIPYEQFLRDNDLEDYISTDGIYSDEELVRVGQAIGIIEEIEKGPKM